LRRIKDGIVQTFCGILVVLGDPSHRAGKLLPCPWGQNR
jgi:hypothetical protein